MAKFILTGEEAAHECEAIPTYLFKDGTVVQFFKGDGMPGYPYFVVINGRKTSKWLAFKPSMNAAKYYYNELAAWRSQL